MADPMSDSLEAPDEAPDETPDETETFDWEADTRPFVAEAPDGERIPLPPSTVLQGRYRVWEDMEQNGRVPDLKGRDLAAVKQEAERVRLGEQFDSFQEFDRCLHSWCVLAGRVAARIKTQHNYCLRVCRFAKPLFEPRAKPVNVKDICRGSGSYLDQEESQPEEHGQSSQDFQEMVDNEHCTSRSYVDQEESPQEKHGEPSQDFEEMVDSEHCTSRSYVDQEESPPDKHGEASQDFQEMVDSEHCSLTMETTHRQPLQDISVNTMHTNLPRPMGGLNKNPRSVVQRTSTWLPSRRAADSATGMKTVRSMPHTGACGQLSRFLPPPTSDDPSDNTIFIPCPFRVRCQRQHGDGRIQITVCELKHTCPEYKHKWRGPSKKASWLGVTLANRVTRNVKVPIRELVEGFQTDYHRNSNYHQLWRGKDLVRDWYLGGQKETFHRIPSLLQCLKQVDPECVVDWNTYADGKTFMRAFICPSGTRPALQFCQPLVSLDACHTKNRKWPTQLFLATVLDGNNQVLVLCYAVAPTENLDNWAWFLRLLDLAIHGIGNSDIPFISDRQKGLIAAVREVFPGKIHGNCANHLRANVKTLYGKGAEHFFLACVFAKNKKRFDDILSQLRKSLAKGMDAADYIGKIETRLYARYAFPLPRFGKVRFKDRRAAALAAEDQFSQPAMRRFQVNLETYGQWQVLSDGHFEAKVQTHDHTEQYLVKRSPQLSCSCVEPQEMCWPCQHVMAWDNQEGKDFTKHFHKCWRIQSLRSLYMPTIPCFLSTDFDLDLSLACYPPEPAVKRGRHRVVRMQAGVRGRTTRELGADEEIDESGNWELRYPLNDDPNAADSMPSRRSSAGVSRQRQAQPARGRGANAGKTKCGRCGGLGHNRRTCSRQNAEEALPMNEQETINEVLSPVDLTENIDGISQQCDEEHVIENTEEIWVNGISQQSNEGEIVNGHYGHTQNPQAPEWMAHNLNNWVGTDEVQFWIDLAESVVGK